MIRNTLFALVLAALVAVPVFGQKEACIGAPGVPGSAVLTVTGTAFVAIEVGGAAWLIVDVNNGAAYDLVPVVCGSSIRDACLALEGGETVTLTARLLPQECATAPTFLARFRSESLFVH